MTACRRFKAAGHYGNSFSRPGNGPPTTDTSPVSPGDGARNFEITVFGPEFMSSMKLR